MNQIAVVPEVVEELTEEELADCRQLELKVYKAFYDCGSALQELRDRRLYRSNYRTFEQYTHERFGFTRRHVDYLISGSQVFENLQMRTIGSHLLPTNERQVRPLTHLEPDEQYRIWQQAVKEAGGRIPSGRIIKTIVARSQELDTTSSPTFYQRGDVVEICAGDNLSLRKNNGYWGIITHVGSVNFTVHISAKGINVQCKHQEMQKIDPNYTVDIRAVSERIMALMQHDNLSSLVITVLETLGRQTNFSPDDLWFLEQLEERYIMNECAVKCGWVNHFIPLGHEDGACIKPN